MRVKWLTEEQKIERKKKKLIQKIAWYAIQEAKKMGIITKMPCEICGEINTEAHHDDYEKPLQIRWVCKKHHEDIHHKNVNKRYTYVS